MNYPWLKHYAKDVPQSIKYPKVPVQQFLLDTAIAHPDYVAMSFNETDTTYRELNEKVNKFVSALQDQGIARQDRVALILVNSPTYVISFFAALKIGAIAVNMSVGLQGEELQRCLNDCGAKALVTLDIFAPNIYRIIRNTAVKTVILHSVFGLEKKLAIEEGAPLPLIFADLLASARDAAEPDITVGPDDVALLQYTSGSTGAPKAATLTHANLVASVYQSDAWLGGKNAGNAAVICLIPFFHVFGMSSCLLVSALKGYRMVLLARFNLMDILGMTKLLDQYKPISFPAVPSLWNAILSLPPDAARAKLNSLHAAVSGGAPLAPAIQEKFEQITGKKLMGAYGLSEASSATLMTPYPDGGPAGSIGVPLPDTQVRIMDLETGMRECQAEEIGELVVKGPQIMQGYWNNAELTATVLRDGWLYTRDMAKMDQDGFFYLVDRKDDLIISNGFNIYPGQIEDILRQHPKVKDAAVIGRPDRRSGEIVTAYIALKEGMEADKEEFLQYCRNNMPDYRVPKTIILQKEIPRDPAGKLLRRVLKGN